MVEKKQDVSALVRAWFSLTGQERLILGSVLAILLVGITARYFHLKNEKPEAYHPEGIMTETVGGKR